MTNLVDIFPCAQLQAFIRYIKTYIYTVVYDIIYPLWGFVVHAKLEYYIIARQ